MPGSKTKILDCNMRNSTEIANVTSRIEIYPNEAVGSGYPSVYEFDCPPTTCGVVKGIPPLRVYSPQHECSPDHQIVEAFCKQKLQEIALTTAKVVNKLVLRETVNPTDILVCLHFLAAPNEDYGQFLRLLDRSLVEIFHRVPNQPRVLSLAPVIIGTPFELGFDLDDETTGAIEEEKDFVDTILSKWEDEEAIIAILQRRLMSQLVGNRHHPPRTIIPSIVLGCNMRAHTLNTPKFSEEVKKALQSQEEFSDFVKTLRVIYVSDLVLVDGYEANAVVDVVPRGNPYNFTGLRCGATRARTLYVQVVYGGDAAKQTDKVYRKPDFEEFILDDD